MIFYKFDPCVVTIYSLYLACVNCDLCLCIDCARAGMVASSRSPPKAAASSEGAEPKKRGRKPKEPTASAAGSAALVRGGKHYTTLHRTTLHYTTLHFTTLRCTAAIYALGCVMTLMAHHRRAKRYPTVCGMWNARSGQNSYCDTEIKHSHRVPKQGADCPGFANAKLQSMHHEHQ